MAKLKIRGKDLREIGFPEGRVISIAINIMQQHYKHYSREEALKTLQQVLAMPTAYENHPELGSIAKALQPKPSKNSG